MGIEIVTSGENVDIGVLAETVPGEVEQDVYELIQTTGGTLDHPNQQVTDDSVGDHGGPLSVRTTTRAGDAVFPFNHRYGANPLLIEAALRDEFANAATVTGSSDIALVTNGTHQDGSTGLQIQAPSTDLAAFITYGGAASNGAAGLLMLMSGWVNAVNNQPVMIKAVWNNGSNDCIDIYPGYGGGVNTLPFGAQKTAEATASPVLRLGSAVRNHQADGSLVRVTLSVLVDFFEHGAAGRFMALRGWMANDIAFAMSGKGPVTMTINGNGRGWSALSMTPQTGEAAGATFVDNTPSGLMYIGGEDLQFLSIVPYPSALNANDDPILLSDANVSAFNFTNAGNVQVVDDIVGTDEVIPRAGRHVPTGSINWYMTDNAVVTQLTQIGARATRQLGALHAGYKDENDLWSIFTFPKNDFSSTGPGGGAAGSAVSGTLNFGAMRLSRQHKAFIYQEIDAG